MGGPTLGAQAVAAGLVDEVHLFVWPSWWAAASPSCRPGPASRLELLDERRFGSGMVYLRYRTQT